MALVDDLRALRNRTLAELRDSHDYYVHTKIAWNIVHKVVQAGNTFTIQNNTTGTAISGAELARKSLGYVAEELTEATFQQFLAIFESFFFELLRLWLREYPRSLMGGGGGKGGEDRTSRGRQVDFKTVLEAPDRASIIDLVIRREINEIMYDRPAGWFESLEKLAKLGCPNTDEINRIAEAKSTRDILIHNRGIVNELYLSKAGELARYELGAKLDVPEPYHRATWELIRKIVSDVSDSAIGKLT